MTFTDNVVTLVASHEDADGDTIELYRVDWPTGLVTFTVDVRNYELRTGDFESNALVSLDLASARKFAEAFMDLTATEIEQ